MKAEKADSSKVKKERLRRKEDEYFLLHVSCTNATFMLKCLLI